MIYGNKWLVVLLLLSFFYIVGCSEKDFYIALYDGYTIKSIDDEIKLYKDEELLEINDLDYKILEFKYNSDVVCLKLDNEKYYMIYYVDSSIYGPFDLESLNESVASLSMTFDFDFTSVEESEGKIYE